MSSDSDLNIMKLAVDMAQREASSYNWFCDMRNVYKWPWESKFIQLDQKALDERIKYYYNLLKNGY